MKIRSIYLKDIRCFNEISIDLSTNTGAHSWALILGNNGTGKTSLLRSIAMGLCDKTGAASLLQDTYGGWVRKGAKEAKIVLQLIDKGKNYTITTTIKKDSRNVETVQQTRPDDFPWERLFVCGYGANRSIDGQLSYDEYSVADAVYTLFSYKHSLQSAELMLRRISENKKEQQEACKWLDKILMLEAGSVKLDHKGLVINGPWCSDVTFGALPDGYAATITMVSDMLGWALLAGKKQEKSKLSGIVIIDEIEQHLHPIWQKQIIMLLNVVFKNIQFISTSHSPLCAIGTANLENAKSSCSIVLIDRGETGIQVHDRIAPPVDKRADQILTSYLFGMETTRSDSFSNKIEKYSLLLGKPNRTESENKLLLALQREIEKPITQETVSEQRDNEIFDSVLNETLNRLFKDKDNVAKFAKNNIQKKYLDILNFEDNHGKD